MNSARKRQSPKEEKKKRHLKEKNEIEKGFVQIITSFVCHLGLAALYVVLLYHVALHTHTPPDKGNSAKALL